jgi:hypothetical protein
MAASFLSYAFRYRRCLAKVLGVANAVLRQTTLQNRWNYLCASNDYPLVICVHLLCQANMKLLAFKVF